LDKEISSASTMIVRPNENIAGPCLFQDGLLKLGLGHGNIIGIQVILDATPRLCISAANSMLKHIFEH
jgi:hypothetical protein